MFRSPTDRHLARSLRKALAPLVVIVAITAALGVGSSSPAGAATCHTTWGSAGKTNSRMTQAPITGARAGQQPCFDRFVIDLRGTPAPGWDVGYVSRVVQDGSGFTVPLRGGAFIQVSVRAPAYDASGHPTYAPAHPSEAVSVAGFRTFRQIAFAGTFEGTTTFGVGVRARLPFRVFVLAGPGTGSRLIVDVAHSWA